MQTISADKRAVVTGGAAGIGLSVAKRLAKDGYAVWILDRDAAKGQRAAKEIATMTRAGYLAFDATDYDTAANTMSAAADALGGIDLLVCCAHESSEKPVEQITEADWDRVVGTDLGGTFFTAQAAVPFLERGSNGCIVLVSSIHARIASGAHAIYSTAMAGVAAVGRSLAADLVPHGVRCCTVSPYTVLTESTRARLDEPGWRELQESTVLNGGIMSPDELADLICYIASEDGRIFNASDIAVDGGMNMFREKPTVSAYEQ